MKLSPGFWQGAAAASSLMLACGYVAYSAGALHLGKSIPPPVEQPAYSTVEHSELFPSTKRGEMFYGSKSMVLVDPAAPPPEYAPPPPASPSHFMGGSKSAMPFTPPPIFVPEQTIDGSVTPSKAEAATSLPYLKGEEQIIMGGFKSPAVRPLVSPPPESKPTSKAAPYTEKNIKY